MIAASDPSLQVPPLLFDERVILRRVNYLALERANNANQDVVNVKLQVIA